MKSFCVLLFLAIAAIAQSQQYLPFRNCDPRDTFQFGVIEFERMTQLNDSKNNEVFVVGHFPMPFTYGYINHITFLNGAQMNNEVNEEKTGETWKYNSGETSFKLPKFEQPGDYQLLIKLFTNDGEQLGCAGLSFTL